MIVLWPVLVLPVVFILALRSAFWSHETAFERTLELYKIHPQVAKDEVISSQKIDEELSKSTIWSVKQWEENIRSGRRLSISILVAAISSAIPFILIISSNPYTFFYTPIMQFLLLGAPVIIGILIFLILRRWDKTCMSELYYEVTDVHERIWVD